MSARDQWAEWLLDRRFGGDEEGFQRVMDSLYPIRDAVLEHAALQAGERLLDVGSGDGLIAFGALQQAEESQVILSDISLDLLVHARQLAHEMNVAGRCRFVLSPAERLAFQDKSVDVITTRSVLIYVDDKAAAFREFFRLLRAGGRLSLFEPINNFLRSGLKRRLWFYDVAPVEEIATKVRALYEQLQPRESDPMLNFDERDLMVLAEAAGFTDIKLRLEAEIGPVQPIPWEKLIAVAGNPKIPTLEEAMAETLTEAERAALVAHMKPLVESGQGVRRMATAYLWAQK